VTNFAILFLCLAAGFLCQRVSRFPKDSGRALNSFVIYLSLPALVLLQFPKLLKSAELGSGLLLLAAMPWVVFALSWLVFTIVGKGWPRATRGALILTAGLGNTSFVGFPMLEALIGPESLRYGVVVDQFGSFLVLSLVGIPLAASYGGTSVKLPYILKRIATFPPFLASLAAVLWFCIGLPGEEI
jgi:malate permease and related proteins